MAAPAQFFVFAIAILYALTTSVWAQPSPQVQKRISAAIKAAATAKNVDYTQFVNVFIGTDNDGDVWYVQYTPRALDECLLLIVT